ncbi:MAG: 1-acyl-sn-glycerol-3-phosphate acyltransferase [Oscillospiraceae bacterium]|nr:1-acyl-sn-glycerol-3-phosphate acyltransferase [Oscillospiraceae bacterium]
MIGEFKRFDMARKPNRQWRVLSPVTWLLSYPKAISHRAKVNKDGMPKWLKPPYFLLCNHNSFMDFMILTKAIFPKRANYVVAIDGYIGREWLLRAVGGICNRKFTKSINLVRNMLSARDNGDIVALFPEARYSLCGTTAVLPHSLGKMVRKMNVPVVTLIMHGHHINSPFWNTGNRKVKPVESEISLLLTQQETQELTPEEINARIVKAFQYDEYAWQKERNILVKDKTRAEGLHKVLYQCPACHVEYKMSSEKSELRCDSCGKIWEMGEDGQLSAKAGETEFSHIPLWYEWERANVRKEVESCAYSQDMEVRVESLPNSKGFVVFKDMATLTHNMDGFKLSGIYENEAFNLVWQPTSMHSCHIEYDYMGRGDCVDLNTTDDTFYLFPTGNAFAITKIALATEELFRHCTQTVKAVE